LVRILFTDVYFDDGTGSIRGPGYIYLKDGIIAGYGEGEPPEELSLAEMVVSGEALVVYPGLSTLLTVVELYPFRSIVGGKLDVTRLLRGEGCLARVLREVSGDAAYYASLMAFYELAMLGVTRPLVLALNPSEVGRAMRDSGLQGAVIVPKGCGFSVEASEPPAGVPVLELSCECHEGKGLCLREGSICYHGRCMPPTDPPVHPEPWLSPWHVMCYSGRGAYDAYILDGHMLVEEGYKPLSGKAHLVAIDVSEPPGWSVTPKAALAWTLASRPRIEIVVSGGAVVVDGGEHLYLGRDAARRAAEKLRDVMERVERACGG